MKLRRSRGGHTYTRTDFALLVYRFQRVARLKSKQEGKFEKQKMMIKAKIIFPTESSKEILQAWLSSYVCGVSDRSRFAFSTIQKIQLNGQIRAIREKKLFFCQSMETNLYRTKIKGPEMEKKKKYFVLNPTWHRLLVSFLTSRWKLFLYC